MNRLRSRKFWAALLLGPAIALLPQAGYAQTTTTEDAAAAENQDLIRLEKYEVTGSYIPYSAEAPAVPVRIVNAADIEATGQATDLLEVIRKSVPQFVGNGNLGSSNSNIGGGSTNGGSQIQLRNVQTLVLINGRRAAFSPVSATGGFNFVDVNSIPVSAVERIEVLKDGASALYGSDAVSGVVNIILKKDYEGAEIGGHYAFARQGGTTWNERSGRATIGAKSGNTSVTLSAEWIRSDPLFQNERGFSADQTGKTSSFAGVVNYLGAGGGNFLLADGAHPPLDTDMTGDQLVAAGIYTKPTVAISSLFNLSPYVTLALGNERTAVTAAVSHQLSENIELFGDLLYSHTETFYQLAAQPIVGMPIMAADTDNFGVLPFAYTLPEHAQNPFDDYVLVRNRFVNNPRQYLSDNDSLRALLGARGEFGAGYSWEVGANFNTVNQMFRNENVINRVNLASGIDNNLVNLFERVQDPTRLAQANIFGTAYSKNESSLISFDGRVTGEFANALPAGAIKFAVGAETRRETMSARPDAGSYTVSDPNSPLFGSPALWDGATTSDQFSVDRSVDSFFAEVRVPIVSPAQTIPGLYTLDVDAAVRKDWYSDTDDPLVPKIMLRWFPVNDQLAVRAAYSESFSAASLFSLFGPAGVGFTEQPIGLELIDGRVLDDNVDQAFLRLLSNPELKPEEAKNYNFGVVYSPKGIKGLNIELNYFIIEQEQIAGTVDEVDILQDVETNGATSQYADRVRINSFNGSAITAPGQISAAFDEAGGSMTRVFVTNYAENFVAAKQDGIDATIDYVFDVPNVGKFDVLLNGLWFNRFSVEDESYVGETNGRSALNGGTIPRWRGNLRTEFTRGNLLLGASIDHIPSLVDPTASEDETDVGADRHVEAWTSVDFYIGYNFKGREGWTRYVDGLSVRVGVNNAFDEGVPMAGSSWTDANADTATYGPWGRVFYVTARYKF